MNFQKPHNNNYNNNSKKMSNMKTQKNTKYQEEDQVFSDDNMGGEEEEVIKGKVAAADAEDKKQKKVVGGKRAAGAGAGTGAGGGSGGGSSGGTCQAEKCTVDLSEAKRYHRRHKVCEFHAKAPYVLISGLRQRFCQQCSRFHELTEFDEAKRSCRRRLAGHNERRRKMTSEPQGEGGSSSRTKEPGANPQCRSTADQVASRAQMTSHPASTPNFKPFQIK